MAKGKKLWIQSAIKRPGALTAKAKRAGMTIDEYCSQSGLDTTTQRQCNLYRTLKRLRPRR